MPKKSAQQPRPASKAPGQQPKGAAASRLRMQTRKVLGKHYRATYGVR